MSGSFNILSYLAGLTGFVFDKDVLQRIALDCGVSEITEYSELTEETKDRCRIALLETVLHSPYSSPSFTTRHGEWQKQYGSQVITSQVLSTIKEELRRLYSKYAEQEKLDSLEMMDATLQFI